MFGYLQGCLEGAGMSRKHLAQLQILTKYSTDESNLGDVVIYSNSHGPIMNVLTVKRMYDCS